MSRHFVYEIDERSLSARLRNLQLPLNEEAWPKFDNIIGTCLSKEYVSKRFQFFRKIHVPLNKNMIIPVMFTIIIILFSLLLFNFVSIKTSGSKNVNSAQPNIIKASVYTKPAEIIKTEETKTPALVAAETINPVSQTPAVVIPTQAVAIKQTIVVQPKVASPVVTHEEHIEVIRPSAVTEDNEEHSIPNEQYVDVPN